MAKYKLILDDLFEDATYTLIAIHCALVDYRVAYFLNKNLSIKLTRKQDDLDLDRGNAFYSIYEWKNEEELTTWNLVSNKYRKEEVSKATTTDSLFNSDEKFAQTYNLMPEIATADYFLKVKTEFFKITERAILNTIQQIPQIITAYSVNTSNLKSKNNLIFS